VTRQVKCLPPRYNGDIIFEIPPTTNDAKKSDRVRLMECAKDCYYWTRITIALALVPKKDGKNNWQFGKMACTGVLECKNDHCKYFCTNGSRNASAWSGNYKMSNVHIVGEPIKLGGLLCSFCSLQPICTKSCDANIYYMYSRLRLPPGTRREHMSRLAIHQGTHTHPKRKVFSLKSFDKVKELLTKHHSSNPTATPSRLKNISIGDILSQVQKGSANGLTKEDEKEL
jgi:hypothetical protein